MKNAAHLLKEITNHNMKKLLVLLLACFVSSFAFSQSKEDKVWARVDALNKAVFGTKDSIAMKDLVSTKLTYGHSGGNLEDMKTMVTNAATSKTTYRNLTTEKISLIWADDAAIVRYILRAGSVDEKGVETPLNIGIMQVWAKEHGSWKLFARQAVKVNPK